MKKILIILGLVSCFVTSKSWGSSIEIGCNKTAIDAQVCESGDACDQNRNNGSFLFRSEEFQIAENVRKILAEEEKARDFCFLTIMGLFVFFVTLANTILQAHENQINQENQNFIPVTQAALGFGEAMLAAYDGFNNPAQAARVHNYPMPGVFVGSIGA